MFFKKNRGISHPNVVQFLGYTEGPTALVTEFVENGDLASYLATHKNIKLSEKILKANNIVMGLRYLHRSKIVHRDLKTTNLVCFFFFLIFFKQKKKFKIFLIFKKIVSFRRWKN